MLFVGSKFRRCPFESLALGSAHFNRSTAIEWVHLDGDSYLLSSNRHCYGKVEGQKAGGTASSVDINTNVTIVAYVCRYIQAKIIIINTNINLVQWSPSIRTPLKISEGISLNQDT